MVNTRVIAEHVHDEGHEQPETGASGVSYEQAYGKKRAVLGAVPGLPSAMQSILNTQEEVGTD